MKLNRALHRYNNYIEKWLTRSKDKTAFHNFINSRIRSNNETPILRKDSGELISADEDKADLLGEVFQKVYNNKAPDDAISLKNGWNDLPHFTTIEPTLWFHKEHEFHQICWSFEQFDIVDLPICHSSFKKSLNISPPKYIALYCHTLPIDCTT